MKLFLSISLLSLPVNLFAVPLTELKIERNWKVKYDPKEWNYIYLKPLSGVSPNIFEHRKEKIKVILQKETHFDQVSDYQKLIEKKCAEGNQYYSQKRSGHAELMIINDKKVCYIEFKNTSGKLNHQFVYPELGKTKTYELYSYAWNSNDNHSKNLVINFLKGFIQ